VSVSYTLQMLCKCHCWLPSVGQRCGEASALTSGACLSTAGPNTDIKRLVVTIDNLQVQQAHAEEQRLAAERAAEAAQRDAASLKVLLHAALLRLAELDDREDAARAALDGRLLEQAQHDEQLR
jgi:RecA/RadA recombinase